MERRRSARPALRRGRRRSRARPRRALRREAPGPGAHGRGGGGRRSVRAHPFLRRDADELDGFFEFLASEISHAGLAAVVDSFVRDANVRRRSARSRPPPPTVITATRAASSSTRSASPRSAGRRRSSTRGSATTSSSPRRSHDVGRIRELGPGPAFRQTDEGRLLGHVHLGLRMIEERGRDLDPAVLAELLHAVACHHDRPAARTAEAAVLYHANQLDAQAATRPSATDAWRHSWRWPARSDGASATSSVDSRRGAWRFSPSSRSHRPSAWSACLRGRSFG